MTYLVKNEDQATKEILMSKGWIGVDLDGTLAHYKGWAGGAIGEPITPMVNRVKQWLDKGIEVRIMTARVSPIIYKSLQEMEGEPSLEFSDELMENIKVQIDNIKIFCMQQFGQELAITCIKDFHMICLYDDRCVQIETNTGRLIGNEHS